MRHTSDLDPNIARLLRYAALAPSSHNTQPWRINTKQGHLQLGYDPARQLTVGDKEKRELFMSLGSFLETLILAGEELGYSIAYDYVSDDPSNVARITYKQSVPSDTGSIALIEQRRSDRRLYAATALEKEAAATIGALHEGGASIKLFSDTESVQFLADMTHQATFTAMSDPAFRQELAGWVRNNWTKQRDGMPAYVQGIPGPVSLVAPLVIKKIAGTAKDQAKKDAERVNHSAAIGLICTRQQTPQQWLEAGRLYQRVCLTALRYGIKTAALSAAVVIPETAHQITEQLQLKDAPVAFIRFGYARGTQKASPRLRWEEFTT